MSQETISTGTAGVQEKTRGGRVQWTTLMDDALLELYEQSEPARRGYRKRLLALWKGRFPELKATEYSLGTRVGRVKSLRLESQPPRTPVSSGSMADGQNGGDNNPPLSGDASPVAQRRVAGDINTCTVNAESWVEPETCVQVEQEAQESPAGPPRGEHSLGDPCLASETREGVEGEADPISGVLSDERSDELQSLQEEILKEVEASQNDLSGRCRFNCRGRRIDPELLKQVIR